MDKQIPVVILGATGTVGQRFVQLLDGHPWFKVTALTGSQRSIGKKYGEVCHWLLPEPMPTWAREMIVQKSEPDIFDVKLAFSALPSKTALSIEAQFAQSNIVVCSNASAFRSESDVPTLLPEVNPDHINLISTQKKNRGWQGCIVTNPNCTSTGLTIALKPLFDQFGIEKVYAFSMQAVSGAGYPGIASLDILDNVIPYIEGEEDKLEFEPRKMLGHIEKEAITLPDFQISAHANRVAISEGHTVCVSISLNKTSDIDAISTALENYQAPTISRDLPSSPKPVIQLRREHERPQPRLDRMSGNGMSTVVGRIRPDSLLDFKMVIVSHNTIRGAAGGSIYNAELLVQEGII